MSSLPLEYRVSVQESPQIRALHIFERKDTMNFFTTELSKIVKYSSMIDKPKYVGRTCVFSLSDKVSGKLYFDTNGYADHYNVLRLHLFNKSEGVIDKQTIRLIDVFGVSQDRFGMRDPNIYSSGESSFWRNLSPTKAEYGTLAEQIDSYLECFCEPTIDDDIEM